MPNGPSLHSVKENGATTMITLIVNHLNGVNRHHAVPPEQGWKIDNGGRFLVIGSGVPRVHVPLDTVAFFEVVEVVDQ